MRWLLFLALVGVAGCTRELVREPIEQVTLSGGLEVRWRSLSALSSRPKGLGPESAGEKAFPLVLTLRSGGAGPVVLCRVLRVEGGGESPGVVFVRWPAPGRFRYDPASDSVAALSEGGSPFSLTPAFAWYEQVLHPGAQGVSVNLGQVPPGTVVRVVVEYLSLSYRRLSVAGYAPSVGSTTPAVAAKGTGGEAEDRFCRLSEELLRQKQPRALFLRTEYLPPVTRVPLEIPRGSP